MRARVLGARRGRGAAALVLTTMVAALAGAAPAAAQAVDSAAVEPPPAQERRLPLLATALVSAAGGGLGLAAGMAATDRFDNSCDLCLGGFVMTFGTNVAGAAAGAMLTGADGSRSLFGAALGFGTGVAVAGYLDGREASREAQWMSYVLMQGLTTALWERYADDVVRALGGGSGYRPPPGSLP